MNTRILKWQLKLGQGVRVHEFGMPPGSEVLTVQAQGSQGPVLWTMCPVARDADEFIIERRSFVIKTTGLDFDAEGLTYVATFQDDGFVGHVFEKDRP